jgi:pimeloyl-ACP methyl ester carboxylesterase
MSTPREDLEFTSGSQSCAAWLFRPEGGQDAPIVVMAHGFTATRRESLEGFAMRFAEAGIAAIVFDYRGFGDSEGERQVLDIARELEDVRSAIEFARGLSGINSERVALWGTSLGGGLTFETAARLSAAGQNGLTCAVAQVPFADGPSMLGAVPPAAAMRLSFEALKDMRARRSSGERVMIPAAGPPGSLAAMTSPDALPGFEAISPPDSLHQNRVAASIAIEVLRWRPGRLASKITCPILVQVATKDQDTPPAPAAKAASKAPLGELKRYACGHFDVYLDPWFTPVVADQLVFLKRHLLGEGT